MKEISKSVDRTKLDEDVLEVADRTDFASSVLRMLFGKEEVIKGEHEVIALAFVLHLAGQSFTLIMDDAYGRKIVRSRIAHLEHSMTGTAAFIARCHTWHSILEKDDALDALEAIRASKFRVTDEVIDSVVEEVQRH